MLILKIKQKGMFIEIPGLSPFRTPAEANISHVSMHLVVSKLKEQGIKKFEIISDSKGKEKVLTQRDFVVDKKPKKKQEDYEERFNKLEKLLGQLVNNQSNPPSNKEQITNKLSSIEKLLKKKQKTKVVHVTQKKTAAKTIEREPVVEELEDTFIPEIDLEGLEMKGTASRKTIKQDKTDIDDSADLLSRIMQSEN